MIADPYAVLGVSPDTQEQDIAKAYRALAKKYHPDVNHGNPAAARKMSEINAAYEQIKNGNGYAGADTAGGANGPYGAYGPSAQNQADPFGFDPFDIFFRTFGGTQGSGSSPFASVRVYLNAGRHVLALGLLARIAERNAEWHYLSALANSFAGDEATALEHAQTAVRMESGNPEYLRLYAVLEQGGRVSAKGSAANSSGFSRGFGRTDYANQNVRPAGSGLGSILNRIMWAILLWNLLSYFFGRILF